MDTSDRPSSSHSHHHHRLSKLGLVRPSPSSYVRVPHSSLLLSRPPTPQSFDFLSATDIVDLDKSATLDEEKQKRQQQQQQQNVDCLTGNKKTNEGSEEETKQIVRIGAQTKEGQTQEEQTEDHPTKGQTEEQNETTKQQQQQPSQDTQATEITTKKKVTRETPTNEEQTEEEKQTQEEEEENQTQTEPKQTDIATTTTTEITQPEEETKKTDETKKKLLPEEQTPNETDVVVQDLKSDEPPHGGTPPPIVGGVSCSVGGDAQGGDEPDAQEWTDKVNALQRDRKSVV